MSIGDTPSFADTPELTDAEVARLRGVLRRLLRERRLFCALEALPLARIVTDPTDATYSWRRLGEVERWLESLLEQEDPEGTYDFLHTRHQGRDVERSFAIFHPIGTEDSVIQSYAAFMLGEFWPEPHAPQP